VLRAELLANLTVTVLAAHIDEHIVGGAVLNASTAVVGISNLFADHELAPVAWRRCLASASALFPDKTLVGYVTGGGLDAATRHGSEPVGPLRIWLR
jgi:hypothetical protein